MVLLHGWMDVSASFQFLVDALRRDWDVYAPDWRGYGLTDWGKSDCYWFPDYLADLDYLLDAIAQTPVNLVGHSLGGNVAMLYAGVQPERIAKLVNLEGFGMAATRPEQAPQALRALARRAARAAGPARRTQNFAELAERLRESNPRLTRRAGRFPGTALGPRDGARARWCCAAIRRTRSSIPCSTATRRCAPAGSRSARRCCGSTAPNPTTLERLRLDATQHAERRAAFAQPAHT